MTTVTVTAGTVEMVAGVHDKFYRAFTVGPFYVFQYGKRFTDGTFKIANGQTERAARSAAWSQLDSKRAKGYVDTSNPLVNFDVDLDEFKAELAAGGDKNAGLWLVRQMALNSQPKRAATPVATQPRSAHFQPQAQPAPPKPKVGIEELTDKALAALSLAAIDPDAGIREYAVLQAKLAEVDSQLDVAHTYVTTLGQMLGIEIPDDSPVDEDEGVTV